MNPDDEEMIALSSVGESRRDQMLTELTHAMRGVHRRRRNVRRIALASTVPIVAILAWLGWNVMQPTATNAPQYVQNSPLPIEQPPSPPPSIAADTQRLATIDVVSTNAAVASQFIITTKANATLSDEELLATLASMNKPTGLIRSNGRVWLTDDVVDKAVVQ